MLPPAYYTLVQRLARLAAVIREAQEQAQWLTVEHGRDKREALRAELQQVLDQALGPAVCPLCHPEVWSQKPRRLTGLRQCVPHSVAIVEIAGACWNARGDTPSSTSSLWRPTTAETLMPEVMAVVQPNSGISNAKSTGSNIGPSSGGAGSAADSGPHTANVTRVYRTPASSGSRKSKASELSRTGEAGERLQALAAFLEERGEALSGETEQRFLEKWEAVVRECEQAAPGVRLPEIEYGRDAQLRIRRAK